MSGKFSSRARSFIGCIRKKWIILILVVIILATTGGLIYLRVEQVDLQRRIDEAALVETKRNDRVWHAIDNLMQKTLSPEEYTEEVVLNYLQRYSVGKDVEYGRVWGLGRFPYKESSYDYAVWVDTDRGWISTWRRGQPQNSEAEIGAMDIVRQALENLGFEEDKNMSGAEFRQAWKSISDSSLPEKYSYFRNGEMVCYFAGSSNSMDIELSCNLVGDIYDELQALLPYWKRYIEEFPEIESLADEQLILFSSTEKYFTGDLSILVMAGKGVEYGSIYFYDRWDEEGVQHVDYAARATIEAEYISCNEIDILKDPKVFEGVMCRVNAEDITKYGR